MNNRRKKERAGFILACILPAIILFLTFLIYPTIEVFRMSMYRWGGFSKNKQFVGFDNFVTLWKDENFSRTIQNTILLFFSEKVLHINKRERQKNAIQLLRREFFTEYSLQK